MKTQLDKIRCSYKTAIVHELTLMFIDLDSSNIKDERLAMLIGEFQTLLIDHEVDLIETIDNLFIEKGYKCF
jgi:hypothetical protein